MTSMTRRSFAGMLAGFVSAASSAKGFVQHRILKRPYYFQGYLHPNPKMLYDCLYMQADCSAPLRIKITQPGTEESVVEVTVRPRPNERFMLLGIHGQKADCLMVLSVESSKPIKDPVVSACFMRPPFRVEDDMMIFHDKSIEPERLHGFIGQHSPIHRKIYGPGADIGYLG